jgi:hypothetical protein
MHSVACLLHASVSEKEARQKEGWNACAPVAPAGQDLRAAPQPVRVTKAKARRPLPLKNGSRPAFVPSPRLAANGGPPAAPPASYS